MRHGRSTQQRVYCLQVSPGFNILYLSGPYDIAVAFAKKFASNDEDSDTSPCRGVARKRIGPFVGIRQIRQMRRRKTGIYQYHLPIFTVRLYRLCLGPLPHPQSHTRLCVQPVSVAVRMLV
ncbi:unnamed protein product [Calicophoron daubneyi]|uniref:Uncharacterized protein n=1 Tax=Calicophoron daubneyi TaxID=300641 RepID=A0AAV2T4Y0_CALDB